MKIPKPKFKKGDKVRVDDFDNATITKVGAFKKNNKVKIHYQLKDNILPGFWVEESRVKKQNGIQI